MTVDQLRTEAALLVAAMRIRLRHGICDPVFRAHWPEIMPVPVFRAHWPEIMPVPVELQQVVQPGKWKELPCPGELMNNGKAKKLLFDVFRDFVSDSGADATILGSIANAMRLTKLGQQQHPNDVNANVDRGFERLVKLGWAEVGDVIHVVGQTKDHVVLAVQYLKTTKRMGREITELDGDTKIEIVKQYAFTGRTKMFGVFNDETLRGATGRISRREAPER